MTTITQERLAERVRWYAVAAKNVKLARKAHAVGLLADAAKAYLMASEAYQMAGAGPFADKFKAIAVSLSC